MKSSQSNFDLGLPSSYLARSYLIATVRTPKGHFEINWHLKVAQYVVPLMEYILADAEVIGEYFKNIIDLYDGDVTSQELYR